ncbi:MAG TPA: bacillithiol biosynthesis cysteine-adding enzyme BshC [Candidatus Sulfotelmatobacter sp.]|nr:bacillithiol biosynthesis cysteine-adding enzyme BshC [Candidatus Sulfotelmatobacter sp.]
MKAHCIPFSQIPHTTRLFQDLLAYTPQVRSFYPRSPYFHEWLKEEAGQISYEASRRQHVTDILGRQNRSWNASEKTLANLDRLRKGAAAIVTGQQVGLFGGPTFSLYKALSAVKLANEATAAGVDAVPVFWLATYDHDLAEVNHVSLPRADGSLETLTTASKDVPGAPVSSVRFDGEITSVVEQAVGLLGDSEASQILRDFYRPGETLGSAFARFYARVFAEWGVILMDPSDPELDRLAEPIYRAAIERADELAAALVDRGHKIEAAGYHQQVKVADSSVLLFTTRHGARTPISRRMNGDVTEFVIDGEAAAEKLSPAQLLAEISSHPERFSPNVLLRPIMQDFLLPTLAYTGGAAEAAYFAQAGVVYEALLGRVTPILPRFSATIVEPKAQRLLQKHEVAITDVFDGPDALRQQIAARNLPGDLQVAFDAARNSFDANMVAVKENLEKLDKTLVDAAETCRSKMQHQLEKLYAQAVRAEALKGELVSRHAEGLSQALYPNKGLQERSIGGVYFLARYGQDLLHQLYETINSSCHDHQVVEL